MRTTRAPDFYVAAVAAGRLDTVKCSACAFMLGFDSDPGAPSVSVEDFITKGETFCRRWPEAGTTDPEAGCGEFVPADRYRWREELKKRREGGRGEPTEGGPGPDMRG